VSPTSLRNANATRLLADHDALNPLLEAVSKVTGLSYEDGLTAYQNRVEALGPAATVGAVLGKDAQEVLPMVRLLDAYTERKQRTLDTALLNASKGAQVVNGRVLISPDTDTAPWLANPEERERRLRRMRAVRMDGAYHGDQGRDRFKKDDREAIEQGWDPVATAEFQNAERQARAQSQAEASRLQAPLDQTTALRQERLNLDTELRELDRRVEETETADAEAKRRGHARSGVPVGRLLERRREVAKRLELVSNDRRIELDSLPGWKVVLEAEKQTQVKSLETDEKGYSPEIKARVRDANKFMLDNPGCDFIEALNAIEEGRTTLAQEDEPRTPRPADSERGVR
jgi:hypothetical protein